MPENIEEAAGLPRGRRQKKTELAGIGRLARKAKAGSRRLHKDILGDFRKSAIKFRQTVRELAKKSERVPANLRFGIVVAVAIFWSDVVRRVFSWAFSFLPVTTSETISAIILAVLATFAAIALFITWPEIEAYLK